jgi:hypothetical protein
VGRPVDPYAVVMVNGEWVGETDVSVAVGTARWAAEFPLQQINYFLVRVEQFSAV